MIPFSATIVMPDADLDMALSSVLFGSVGTAGQRCTSTRRLYLHRSIASSFLERLKAAYAKVPIGDPLNPSTLLGPLHSEAAKNVYHSAVSNVLQSGGTILSGGQDHTPSSS